MPQRYSRLTALVGLVALLTVAYIFWQPKTNAANILPDKNIFNKKDSDLGTSLHLDRPENILNNLGNKDKVAQDLLLATPSPIQTPSSDLSLPKPLSRIGIERTNKGLIIEYKFKEPSEQAKAARAADPLVTPPWTGR